MGKLTNKEFNTISKLLAKATNKDLHQIQAMVEKEVRLSETSIREGFEKRR